MHTTYNCQTCGTELKRHEAVLRGNAIDDVPAAWCRRDAVALGILNLPTPRVEVPVVPTPRRASLFERLGLVASA